MPKRGGNRRNQKKPHHDDAVQREQLVVGVVGDKIRFRRQQLQAHDADGDPAEKKECRDGEREQNRDALVVGGQQPGAKAFAHASDSSGTAMTGGNREYSAMPALKPVVLTLRAPASASDLM